MPDQEEPHNCPVAWLIDVVGRYLAGDDADDATALTVGREAVTRGALQANELLRSAYAAHEVIATEIRFAGVRRGSRRTLFAEAPTPVALLVLCVRLCDPGDEVTVMLHTAADGTSSHSAIWPFGTDVAERLTRPPGRDDPTLPPVTTEDHQP
jgi:hypothetical protein